MHLYLRDAPQRALILVTSSDDEIRSKRPRRALVFRAGEGAKASSQAIVEFIRKDEADINGAIRLTPQEVMGCLGLISVGGGACREPSREATDVTQIDFHLFRAIPCSGDVRYCHWKSYAERRQRGTSI